jgi:hypothetical protein
VFRRSLGFDLAGPTGPATYRRSLYLFVFRLRRTRHDYCFWQFLRQLLKNVREALQQGKPVLVTNHQDITGSGRLETAP